MSDLDVRITGIQVQIDAFPVDKTKVHLAMAQAYLRLVQGTFGQHGEFRQSEWQPLSPRYAKRVGRPYATLYVSGRLYRSISASADAQAGHVISEGVPYNLTHQQGYPPRNIPRRPFFPMWPNGQPTDLAVKTVTEAAMKAVNSQ